MASQKNDLAEKKRVLIDNEELPGLVRVGEVPREKGILEVPEYSKIRKIHNGVTTVPNVEMSYKRQRNTKTFDYLQSWHDNHETHDVIIIDTDGAGAEIGRTLYSDCECAKFSQPEYAAESPTYARVDITLLPWEITHIN